MRLSLLTILFLFQCGEILSQGFWFRPDKYFYQPNEVAKVELLDGRDFIGSPIPFSKGDLVSLEVHFRNLKTDIRKNLVELEKASVSVQLTGEGIYQIRLQAKPKEVQMRHDDFLEFVKQYGLEDAADIGDSLGADSVVLSITRNLKGYIRVGKQFDRRPEESSLSLEIVPDKNPLLLNRGEKITFTVRKNGKPVFGARVKIWNRWDNRTTVQHIYTQQDGTVSTTISSPGDWMVSVVELEKVSGNNSYVGRSYSLLFGYR